MSIVEQAKSHTRHKISKTAQNWSVRRCGIWEPVCGVLFTATSNNDSSLRHRVAFEFRPAISNLDIYTQHSIYLAILGTLTSQPSECLSVAHYPFLLRYHKAGTIVRLCVRALRMQHFPFRSVDGAFEWFGHVHCITF